MKITITTGLLASTLLLPTIGITAELNKTLQSSKTTSAPSIDGKNESVWEQATPIEVLLDEQPYEPNNGYEGRMKTTVSVKALHDDDTLYMKLVWADETVSLARFPWEKQTDGSWKQLKNNDSTLHENTYYEDKFAIYWNISEKSFKKKGCDKSCHILEDGLLDGVKDSSAGRHYTRAGFLDEWHWKSTRTNVNQQMDDGFLDSEHETNDKWGRHEDTKTGGGYYNNVVKTNPNQPGWMNEESEKAAHTKKPVYHLVESTKVPFVDNFKAGARLPGIVTAPFEGGRADVKAKGYWENGHWTLEIQRKLKTLDNPDKDIQFTDLDKVYYFGVTAFDNSQIAHLHHTGSLKLIFKH